MRGLVPGGWEADQGLSFNTSSVEALAKTKDSLVRLCLLAGLEILSVSPPPDWAGGGGGGEGSLSNLLKIFPVYLQCIIWNRNAVGDSLSCVFFFPNYLLLEIWNTWCFQWIFTLKSDKSLRTADVNALLMLSEFRIFSECVHRHVSGLVVPSHSPPPFMPPGYVCLDDCHSVPT